MRYSFEESVLDDEQFELRRGSRRIHVEPQVFDVLLYLIRHRQRVVSKEELLDEIWGTRFVTESTLTTRIKAARRAIGDDGTRQSQISTVRGRGFRFIARVDETPSPGDSPPDPPDTTSADAEPRTAEPEDPGWPDHRGATVAAPRTRLIGRLADLTRIDELVDDHRMVTITGPGGAGKSTLALAVARQRLDGNEEDVVFVELAPVHDLVGLVQAVAEASRVQGAGATDVRKLATTLAGRRLILILDNCEHLLDAAAALVDALLDAGPTARILATSREPLGVDGEATHSIASLGDEAALLFVERGLAVAADASLDPHDRRVTDLCASLDGLPLAIELAAAQLPHMTLDDLIMRLDDRLSLLVGSRPRAGSRHSALATTIEWSYKLLTEPSRQLFVACGVFPATFDLSATVAVVGDMDEASVTTALADLVAKNLVVHDHSTGRYHLLETIRLFASEVLADSGLAAGTNERLRRHVVERMTAMPRHRSWMSASLAAANRDDLGNVRMAFEASIANGEHTDAVDIAIGLTSLWRNAVSYTEGLRWVELVSECDLAAGDEMWVRIIEADLGLGSGNPRPLANSAAEAVDIAAALDEPYGWTIATVLQSLVMDDPNSAAAGLAAARAKADQLGEPALARLARAFLMVARLLAGDRSETDDEIAALTSAGATGTYDRYICLWASWVHALADNDGPTLRMWMDTQLENLHGSGLQENWLTMFCHALTLIGEGEPYLGQLRLARRRAELEGRRAESDCVLALGYAAACDGDPERGAVLLGASGTELSHDTANFIHHLVIRDHVVRPMLDTVTFDAAIARGEQLSVTELVAEYDI